MPSCILPGSTGCVCIRVGSAPLQERLAFHLWHVWAMWTGCMMTHRSSSYAAGLIVIGAVAFSL